MIRVFTGICRGIFELVVMGAYPMEAGIMLATDRDKGFSACIVTDGQRVTLVPKQLTIFVVIMVDLALIEFCGCWCWLLAGWAEVMLMVSEGQRSASEAMVIAPMDDEPSSISGMELLLLLLILYVVMLLPRVVELVLEHFCDMPLRPEPPLPSLPDTTSHSIVQMSGTQSQLTMGHREAFGH